METSVPAGKRAEGPQTFPNARALEHQAYGGTAYLESAAAEFSPAGDISGSAPGLRAVVRFPAAPARAET